MKHTQRFRALIQQTEKLIYPQIFEGIQILKPTSYKLEIAIKKLENKYFIWTLPYYYHQQTIIDKNH